jgi:hypothetical protein
MAALAAFTPGCGCGGDGGETHNGAYALHVQSASTDENGDVACPRDAETVVTVEAVDEAGALVEIDPNDLEWESSDGAAIEIVSTSSASATLVARRDWFDSSADASARSEPSATITVRYGSLETETTARGVINADGTWLATLAGGPSLTLSLAQTGRTLVETNYGYTGVIHDDALSLAVSGYSVDATFTSRTEVEGTVNTSSGPLGSFTCEKQ